MQQACAYSWVGCWFFWVGCGYKEKIDDLTAK